MDEVGSSPTLLLEGGRAPAWSPDGTTLAVERMEGEGGCLDEGETTSVVLVPASGGEPRVLAEQGGAPAWSPDGTRIAFHTDDGEIVVVRADGTDRRTVGWPGGFPAWSPDGTRLAFHGTERINAGDPFDIFVVNADGTGRVNLTESDSADEMYPRWRPLPGGGGN
jgi:dipeptidyl aminopeptidase/acylaminoacyl peptidase